MAPAAVGRERPSVSEAPPARGPTVLVADDESAVLEFLTEAISGAGYRVFSARTGQEALQTFRTEHPELIITDLDMPGMNGLELIEAVKAVSPETEILILTAHSGVDSAIHALRQGVFDYLVKPVALAELEWSVKRALERSRLVAENRVLLRRLQERVQVQEKEVSASQQRTLAVFNSVADSLLIVNREFTISEANEAAAMLTGVLARELVGRKCYRELFAREGICPDCPVLTTLDTGSRASVPMAREDPGGSRQDLEVTSYPLVAETGVIHEAVEHIRDVTASKRAEAERLALRAQADRGDAMRMIGRLAAGIAHDVNNQLTVIKGCVQFLLEAMSPNNPYRGDAERINTTVDRGAKLVRQLLAFSRRQDMQSRPVSLPELIDGMLPTFRRILGERCHLRVRVAPGLWPVRVDPGQIEQVIMNLIVNARDAMASEAKGPRVGTLTVEMSNVELDEASFRPTVERIPPGPYVMLAVGDTGSGMTAEVRDRIFDPFFTTKDPAKGTGLGLSIVYGIVKEHHGYVFCESEPGRGATFRIYLPRDQHLEEAPAKEPAATAARGPTREKLVTVLLAEDDEAVRAIVGRGLEEAGYRVYVAGSVEEALAVAATLGEPIQLLVTDVDMPGGSGYTLAERLRAISPTVKILFISGDVDGRFVGPEIPGTFSLQKPFSPDDLVKKVREVLGG